MISDICSYSERLVTYELPGDEASWDDAESRLVQLTATT